MRVKKLVLKMVDRYNTVDYNNYFGRSKMQFLKTQFCREVIKV